MESIQCQGSVTHPSTSTRQLLFVCSSPWHVPFAVQYSRIASSCQLVIHHLAVGCLWSILNCPFAELILSPFPKFLPWCHDPMLGWLLPSSPSSPFEVLLKNWLLESCWMWKAVVWISCVSWCQSNSSLSKKTGWVGFNQAKAGNSWGDRAKPCFDVTLMPTCALPNSVTSDNHVQEVVSLKTFLCFHARPWNITQTSSRPEEKVMEQLPGSMWLGVKKSPGPCSSSWTLFWGRSRVLVLLN